MVKSIGTAFVQSFMGNAPDWYKLTILFFLILNPVALITLGPVAAGWMLIAEFIYTLAMALKCYPLLPGGLIAFEAVVIGLTHAASVYREVSRGLEVLLLLIFMVAGIYFIKDLLLFIFTKLLIKVRDKIALSLMFCCAGAFLSAFLDALTVTAVVITVSVGFYGIYHRFASGKSFGQDHDHNSDSSVHDSHRADLDQFRAFLRSLMMHAAVGTALGGVCTLVGEPQNLLIASESGWVFKEFFLRMAPVTLPVLAIGLATCVTVELFGWFGYGARLPHRVRQIMIEFDHAESASRTTQQKLSLGVQAGIAVWLMIGLLFHMAPVGLIGLSVIVLAAAFTGINDEARIGLAFKEALPFTALLVVFFAIVAVIDDQKLFRPLAEWVLSLDGLHQIGAFYVANGLLSAISDNVFVASIYIGEAQRALQTASITGDQYDLIAVAINTGTNIPSVATPNGQAAFLFLLTSALAPLIRLSYGRMVMMALPYTIAMSLTGFLAVMTVLEPVTSHFYQTGALHHHAATIAVTPIN